MDSLLWLIPLGFLIGAYGTLIGAGGGFVLMPVLILLYPDADREVLTSISLAVVFLNASSGSWAYARLKRIDYQSGLLFSITTVPGAILGALTTGLLPHRLFDGIFGGLLIAASVIVFLGRVIPGVGRIKADEPDYYRARRVVEADGSCHLYSYDLRRGMALSFFVGFISSLLGIGGGIIHVPALVYLLDFPVHIATATSHFMLAIMALAGTGVHVATGTFSHGVRRTILLGVGVVFGAQLGAALSDRVRGRWIIRGLAVALGFVGVRILMTAL